MRKNDFKQSVILTAIFAWQIRHGALVGGLTTLKHLEKVILFPTETQGHSTPFLCSPAPAQTLSSQTTAYRAGGSNTDSSGRDKPQEDVIRIWKSEMNALGSRPVGRRR